jgi:tRNA pseudouridine38-40 synthase
VRIITGTLRTVGEGKWGAADLAKALDARDRTAAGQTAPPDGLYLVRVSY